MFYKGKNHNLRSYLAVCKNEQGERYWDEIEVFTIMDYLGSMGEFSNEDEKHLRALGYAVTDFQD